MLHLFVFYVILCWLFIFLKTLNIFVFFAVSIWCFLHFEVKTFDNVLKRSMEIFFFWWQRLKALILIFNVCRRERSTIYSMSNWSMGLFLLYSHIRSLFFKKNRTHQVELVSWWWLFGEARTTHQTIYQSWGGGIIRLWNVVKVTFWSNHSTQRHFLAFTCYWCLSAPPWLKEERRGKALKTWFASSSTRSPPQYRLEVSLAHWLIF